MTHLKLFLALNATEKRGGRSRPLASFCSLKAPAEPKVTRPSARERAGSARSSGRNAARAPFALPANRRRQSCRARERVDVVVWCGVCVCARTWWCVFVCARGAVPDYLAEQHIAASLPVSRGSGRAIASDYL